MGICGSTPSEEAEAKKKSQAIDRALQEDQQRLRRECKILLLGMQTPSRKSLPTLPLGHSDAELIAP